MKFLKSPYLSIWLAVAVSLFALCFWLACPPKVVFLWTEEGGPVESLTEYIYMGAMIITLLFGASILRRKTLVAILLVLGYMLAREADLHKALFSMSMLKIKFWLSRGIPITDKLMAAAILLPAIWAGLYLLIIHFRPTYAAIRKRLPYAISILMVVVVTVISKIIDRSLNAWIETFGGSFPEWLWALQASEEELLECLIPVLFIVAFFQYRRHVRQYGRPSFSNP